MNNIEILKDLFRAIRKDKKEGTHYVGAWVENRGADAAIFRTKCEAYRRTYLLRFRRHIKRLFAAVGINGTSGAKKRLLNGKI